MKLPLNPGFQDRDQGYPTDQRGTRDTDKSKTQNGDRKVRVLRLGSGYVVGMQPKPCLFKARSRRPLRDWTSESLCNLVVAIRLILLAEESA